MPSRSEPLHGLESPFLDRELFTGQAEEEWEAHLAHLGELEAESPFLSAFEQPRAQPLSYQEEAKPVPRSEAEDYEPPAAEWSPEFGGEQTEDFTGEAEEEQAVDFESPLEEAFDVQEEQEVGAARPTLRQGSRGESVRELQLRLQSVSKQKIKVDGIFGPDTRAALIDFQERHRLNPDGVVERPTWDALLPVSGGPALNPPTLQRLMDANNQANERARAHDHAGALKIERTLYADPALALKPEMRRALVFNMGTDHHSLRQFDKAIQCYLEAICVPGGTEDTGPLGLERIREARLGLPPTPVSELRRRWTENADAVGAPQNIGETEGELHLELLSEANHEAAYGEEDSQYESEVETEEDHSDAQALEEAESETDGEGQFEAPKARSAAWGFESKRAGGHDGKADTYEVQLEENEFRVDRLPAKAQAQFSKTDSAAWRDAVAEAIGVGVKNPNDLADIIFFMQHRDRIVNGVGKPIDKGELDFFKLRAEWNLYHTIANRRLSPSAACAVFLPVKSGNYEQYVARHTTGRITPMVNGRTSGRNETEAFDDMQKEVESLGPNDSIFLAAYLLNPTSLTVAGPAGLTNWGDLLARKAQEGVKIRIIISDLPPDTPWGSDLKALNTTIGQLQESARDNLKYIASPHPAKVPDPRKLFLAKVSVAAHHQKFMVVRKGRTVVAYCGGLDISPERIPAGWTSKFVWHDIHAKLEGLVARDIEREFVLRWNREKDKSTATKLADWKPFENLAQAPLGSADREPGKNTHKLQVLRTLSVGVTASDTSHPETWHPDVRRDDIWQGYFRLIGCASRFLFMENQYFHEPKMADAIVKQAEAQADLLVIIVVAFEIDDPTNNALTEHGRALQNEFFTRLFAGIPTNRRRVYTMSGRLVHSKLVLVDDQALSMGSANANPRDFFMDTQLNVMLDDAEAVRSFRHRLWSHDLGVSEAKVAGWAVSDFMAQWDAVAKANGLKKTPDQMTGEGVISFDPTKVKGKKSSIPDFLTELDGEELGEDAPSGES